MGEKEFKPINTNFWGRISFTIIGFIAGAAMAAWVLLEIEDFGQFWWLVPVVGAVFAVLGFLFKEKIMPFIKGFWENSDY